MRPLTDKVNLSVTADILFLICLLWLIPSGFGKKKDGMKGDDFYENLDYLSDTFRSKYHFSIGVFPIGKSVVFYMILYIFLSISKLLLGLLGD